MAEECRSAHCALLRSPSAPELAKELENGAASVHGDARAKVESSAKVAGWLSSRGGHGLQSRSPATKGNKAAEYLALGDPLKLFGHQFDGAGVVPVRARRDGLTRTADKRKMARVKLQVKQRVEFRPNGRVKRHAIVTVALW